MFLALIVIQFSTRSYDTKNSELKEQLSEANEQINALKFYESDFKVEEKTLEHYKDVFCHHMKKDGLVLIDVDSDHLYYHDVHVAEYCHYISDFSTDYFLVKPISEIEYDYTPCPDCESKLSEYYPNHE